MDRSQIKAGMFLTSGPLPVTKVDAGVKPPTTRA
jgi:hypothetical protein